MTLDHPASPQPRIAIIGSGAAGLGALWALSSRLRPPRVTLFESAPRLGGHARTVVAGRRGDQPVDTGFIVFNHVNYPTLLDAFERLGVPTKKSDMSFGASIDGGRIEYGLKDLAAMFAQRRNLLRPGFWRMTRDILRFNARAVAAADDPDMTIDDLMRGLGLGAWFERYYLLPISGAIWSTPTEGIRDFPAQTLTKFFENHALLSATGQHQWWTVDGGSREYVARIEAAARAAGAEIRLNAPVRRVDRDEGGARVLSAHGAERFDHVIFACHSDEALALLAQPSAAEQEILGAIRYQDNDAYLHADPAQMPRRRAVWSSWVHQADLKRPNPRIGVTYWMNRLQSIPEDDPLFVTLNPIDPIPEARIYDQTRFRHPVFDLGAIRAQARLPEIQGRARSWFCGAWTRYGFHEDGFASGLRAAEAALEAGAPALAAE